MIYHENYGIYIPDRIRNKNCFGQYHSLKSPTFHNADIFQDSFYMIIMNIISLALSPLIWCLVILPCCVAYAIVKSILLAYHLSSWITKPNKNNLRQYGAMNDHSWAVITGASSGIGEQMAYEICQVGFHIVIIARRKEMLEKVKQKIHQINPNCQVKIILADLSKAFDIHDSLIKEVEECIGDRGEVRMFMHFAGNSDLAVHFTDKSVDRNVSVMRLVVESTLVLVQLFTEMMCKKSKGKQCAIMTCGALTAYTPAPTFATSSANKHYVRALTHSLAAEYHNIDFMIAHHIAVKSEILQNVEESSNIGGMIIDSDVFVRNIVAEMGCPRIGHDSGDAGWGSLCLHYLGLTPGANKVDLNGHWKHDILVYLMHQILPLSLVHKLFYQDRVEYNSEFLQRPIDTRSLLEKF